MTDILILAIVTLALSISYALVILVRAYAMRQLAEAHWSYTCARYRELEIKHFNDGNDDKGDPSESWKES